MTSARGSRSVILCVDERETQAQIGLRKQVLENAGYKTLTAKSADEAMQVLRAQDIDLVLTEHIENLSSRLKRLKPMVTIAIYSADWEESPEDWPFAEAFISKLVPIEEFFQAIKKMLGEKSSRAGPQDPRV